MSYKLHSLYRYWSTCINFSNIWEHLKNHNFPVCTSVSPNMFKSCYVTPFKIKYGRYAVNSLSIYFDYNRFYSGIPGGLYENSIAQAPHFCNMFWCCLYCNELLSSHGLATAQGVQLCCHHFEENSKNFLLEFSRQRNKPSSDMKLILCWSRDIKGRLQL